MIPKSNCIGCNIVLFDNETEQTLGEGDFATCIYCGDINQFDENLKLISPNTDVPVHIVEASRIIKLVIEAQKHKPDTHKA